MSKWNILKSFIRKYRARCNVAKNPGYQTAITTCDDISKRISILEDLEKGESFFLMMEHVFGKGWYEKRGSKKNEQVARKIYNYIYRTDV